ncbi:Ku protein [Hansschlegelia quercus]|uniref:Non-homologous end joining protein Ku n=1 Tax=Hansschlegelia quercus TaxID=2528245 RepID=A0A4Q9GLV1_9HYPH|nr:Ku protein [Hansschlegelia quercus]TBN55278.1 Ku protein [Hansschlegelia quercus]
MAPRANWKGFLKVGELACPVALYTAASTSDRIAFHTLNRATGNRVRRIYVDAESGKPVERDDQVKGYEVSKDDYIILEADEVAAVVPESDKTLDVEHFLRCGDIDDVYFDKPYYLAPADKAAHEAYNLIVEGMRAKKAAALARTVLFRRLRTVLIRPSQDGLIATTLNFDYEVRSSKDAFDEIPKMSIKGEMLDLAKYIIQTKKGSFDPTKFDDRYEEALTELVKAKAEGRTIETRKAPEPKKVIDLMEALRASAGAKAAAAKEEKPAAKKAAKTPAIKKPAVRTPTRKAS